MVKRLTLHDLASLKGVQPLVGLTAASAAMAALLDPWVDLIHVGDALAMVAYGRENTLRMEVDLLAAHAEAVVRATHHAFVSVDLPFGTYQGSPQDAFRVAARLLSETGAQAVKLEGGVEMAETVAFLVGRGIPVIGHIGLMPGHIHLLGGFKAQGLTVPSARRIEADARALEQAGACALLLEAVAEPVARTIARKTRLVTFGIGASPACDGQILVTEDLLGLGGEHQPKFVARYANLAPVIQDAVRRFAEDVRAHQFPELRHCYGTAHTEARIRVLPPTGTEVGVGG